MIDKPRIPWEPAGGDQELHAPKSSLALPKILEIEVVRIRFREPRPYYIGQKRLESSRGVELRVSTDSPIPIRALSPALYVGEAVIDAYEEIGKNVYRFIAYRVDELKEGAPIAFGWLNAAKRVQTEFHYTPKDAEEEER